MTTPLNFIFAPFGMDWMGLFAAGCIVWACPTANGVRANNRASPQSSLCGRNVVATFVLISAPSKLVECTQKSPVLLFAVIRPNGRKTNIEFSLITPAVLLQMNDGYVANEII